MTMKEQKKIESKKTEKVEAGHHACSCSCGSHKKK